MSVFNGQIQTPLAVPDPGTDWMLPPPGSLNYGGITSFSALAGTNGTDTLLVHGDRDRQMNGNESTRITQNRSHTVGGNQQKKVAGNKLENVVGNFAQTTIGNLSRSIIGATNDLYTGAKVVEHKAQQLIQEPVVYLHNIEDRFEKGKNHGDEFLNYSLVSTTAMNYITRNYDFKGLQVAAIGASAEKAILDVGDTTLKIRNSLATHRNEGINSRIGAAQPVVHVTMIHEVAITQKIIILGVNQYV